MKKPLSIMVGRRAADGAAVCRVAYTKAAWLAERNAMAECTAVPWRDRRALMDSLDDCPWLTPAEAAALRQQCADIACLLTINY